MNRYIAVSALALLAAAMILSPRNNRARRNCASNSANRTLSGQCQDEVSRGTGNRHPPHRF